jgi:iron(III) transport system permease protein
VKCTRPIATILTALIFVVIVVLPIGAVFWRSVWGDDGFTLAAYGTVLTGARQWVLLGNSLAIAAGTAALATVLGVASGLALEYHRVPTRRVLSWCLAVPFLVPPSIFAMAWVDCLGNNGLVTRLVRLVTGPDVSLPSLYTRSGVVLVLGLAYFPVVALSTVVALRRFDYRLIEAARLAGRGRRLLPGIVLPVIAPAVLTGTLFVFVLALVGMAVPSLLQINTYPVELHAASADYDYPAATAQAFPLLACGLAAFAVWGLFLRPRQAWLTGARRPRGDLPVSRHGRAGLTVFCWTLVLVSAALPLFTLVLRADSPESFVTVLISAKEEMAASLAVGAGAATVLTTLALLMAFLARGSRWLARLQVASIVPFLASGPILGMGLIALWNRHGPAGAVYDSLAVVVLACAARYCYLAHVGFTAAMRDLHPSLDEAAVLAGVPWYRRLIGIVVPLLWPALAAAWGLGFLFAVREVDATVLVCPPGVTTLPVRLFTLMHYGPSSDVAALSLLTVALILIGAAMTAVAYNQAKRIVNERH